MICGLAQLSSRWTKPWTNGNLITEKALCKFKNTTSTDFALVYRFLTGFRISELVSCNDASRKNLKVAQALFMSGYRLRERERYKGRFSLTSNRSGKKSSRLAGGSDDKDLCFKKH
jgi:hypothetical protein